jgi:hypothetical protein
MLTAVPVQGHGDQRMLLADRLSVGQRPSPLVESARSPSAHGFNWAAAQAGPVPGAGMRSGLNLVAVHFYCSDLKPKTRQPQLVHIAVEGEKDPAAQAMVRKSWEARRAKA